MTPEQFLSRLAKQNPAPAYLFLGPEAYQRKLCRQALLDKVLPGETRTDGFAPIDLESSTLAEVLDDARSLSLFATSRVMWVASAETALPRRLTSAGEEEDSKKEKPAEGLIESYLRTPTPDTVIVFECSRYDFSGDDKAKLDRVAKFYSAIPDVVEFRPHNLESVRFIAQDVAKKHQLQLGGTELAFLIEILNGDAARIATEIEKLSLYVGTERKVTLDDLRTLVPNAAESTVFTLVNALGKRDRTGALRSLDALVREGEYLPLALTFLGTQFRLALAAKETGIRNAQQALSYFTKQGIRMWRDRAEQVIHTASVFDTDQLQKALSLIYETDKGLRDTRPDDRTVMETLVFRLTKS